MTRLASLALLFASLGSAGCRRDPRWCDDRPGNFCGSFDAPSDTPARCTSSAECAPPTPACDLAGSMTCVQCVAPDQVSACTGTTPACGNDHVCRACKAHSECASSACLDDGSCASESEVAYVDPAGTDNAVCSKTMPCTKVAKALATNRPYVKFHGTTDEAVTIADKNVTLLADPGAKLTRTNNGNILVIDGTSKVAIFDLEISGASGTGVGVSVPSGGAQVVNLTRVKLANNVGGGLSAGGGQLIASRSMISTNTGGGISLMNATFTVVGNVFFGNGTQTSLAGAIVISAPASASNRLEFNSFAKNAATNGVAPAIQCTVAGAFTARNNIMSENGTLSNMNQVGGTCAHEYSIARPGTVPTGTGNSAADPLFVDTTTGDLHIASSSPARDAAEPNADLSGIASRDIDGDVRSAPADIGADQVP